MKKIKKAVVLAAGRGTRFLPITKTVPKELLPIVDKSALQYIIEEAVDSGIEEVILIINPYKKVIQEYFSNNDSLESYLEKSGKLEQLNMIRKLSGLTKITYVIQDKALGTGHAISLVKPLIKNEPFAIMYGDDLTKSEKPVLQQLIDVYERHNCNVIGVKEVDASEVFKYGIMDYENEKTGKIKSLSEKPQINDAPSTSAGLGRYILKPEIFNELEIINKSNGEYLLTDAMINLMKKQPFYSCKFNGKYYDIGSKLGYLKANIEYGLEREDIKDELQEYLKNKGVF